MAQDTRDSSRSPEGAASDSNHPEEKGPSEQVRTPDNMSFGAGILPEQPAPEPPRKPEAESVTPPIPEEGDQEYHIVEPPEGDDAAEGFESIPPGPTEEVRFDELPRSGGRLRRADGRRQRPRRAEPKARPASKRLLVAALIAAAVAVALILIWILSG